MTRDLPSYAVALTLVPTEPEVATGIGPVFGAATLVPSLSPSASRAGGAGDGWTGGAAVAEPIEDMIDPWRLRDRRPLELRDRLGDLELGNPCNRPVPVRCYRSAAPAP